MSRIGKYPVPVPAGVTVTVDGDHLKVKGAKGELSLTLVPEITAELKDGKIWVAMKEDTNKSRAMWGMQRTLVRNMITGVTTGFTKNLEINGVGYRAQVKGAVLVLQLGYSHDVEYPIPSDIKIECEKPTLVKISGIDVQKVGQVAAEIRSYRGPEPYKGKGVKYAGEKIYRKEGKKK